MRVLAQKSPKIALDQKDWRIIKELISNVRQPLSQIAKKTLLSRQSVEYRIKQLQANNLIIGSRTIINIPKLDYRSYHIFLELHSPDQEQILINRALHASYVNAVIQYSGKYNLEISIIAKDADEFLNYFQILTQNIAIRNDTFLILLSTIRSEVLPPSYFPKQKEFSKNKMEEQSQLPKKTTTTPLQPLDLKLLYALSNDANITNITLAHQLNVSKDTIAQHIKQLEAQKYIIQYRPVINYAVLELSINSLLIKINSNPQEQHKFEQFLKTHSSILWATKTFGHYNYLIYAITKNLDEFHDLINTIKDTFQNLIKTYEILFAFKETKYQFMAESMIGDGKKR